MIRLYLDKWFDEEVAEDLAYLLGYCILYSLCYLAIAYVSSGAKFLRADILQFPEQNQKDGITVE